MNMRSDQLLKVALAEYDQAMQAAQDASSADMMAAAKKQWSRRVEEIDLVRAAELGEARRQQQEYAAAAERRRSEIITNVPECADLFDVGGMLALLEEIRETGFSAAEEDYLREVAALIRRAH